MIYSDFQMSMHSFENRTNKDLEQRSEPLFVWLRIVMLGNLGNTTGSSQIFKNPNHILLR